MPEGSSRSERRQGSPKPVPPVKSASRAHRPSTTTRPPRSDSAAGSYGGEYSSAAESDFDDYGSSRGRGTGADDSNIGQGDTYYNDDDDDDDEDCDEEDNASAAKGQQAETDYYDDGSRMYYDSDADSSVAAAPPSITSSSGGSRATRKEAGHAASRSISHKVATAGPPEIPERGGGGSRRRKPSEMTIRQRSQSGVGSVSSKTPTAASFDPSVFKTPSEEKKLPLTSDNNNNRESGSQRPTVSRTASAVVASKLSIPPTRSAATPAAAGIGTPPKAAAAPGRALGSNAVSGSSAVGPYVPFPPLDKAGSLPEVEEAPASGMYWTRAPMSGVPHTALRAHTATLVGSNVYVFGGCDSRACFNQLYVLDGDTFHWSTPHVTGTIPIPLRAMTCTAVNKRLVIFGGGDGPSYYNDVYVLDTLNFRWSKPRIMGDKVPSKRRAHTACLYKTNIYIFGGGDGVRALNDIWRLDVSDPTKMTWRQVPGPERLTGSSLGGGALDREARPKARGYHTANIVGNKIVVFGGSDGGECFNDVWIYSLDKQLWQQVNVGEPYRRLSHSATLVGSYLFVIGGHDGEEYSNGVLLFNLTTLMWERRRIYGEAPVGRGYHTAVLHDGRLVVIGGFDGTDVFGDVWLLELAVHAYYSQICHFSIEV